jgi:hypothetical protein
VYVRCLWIAALAACGEPPHATAITPVPITGVKARPSDPDLDRPARRLLAIDWPSIKLANEAEALALWKQIAPTGADWDRKLEEIPTSLPLARSLAVAMLREGNFTCRAAPASTHNCIKAPIEVDPPAPTATLADPCLRRLLAMWSIEQLEQDDIANVRDSLAAIAALPPPESQLVTSAIRAIPEADHDARLKILVTAWKAGQREVVNANLGSLDEAQLIEAVTKYHIDGAVEILSAEAHKAVYLGAVVDASLPAAVRAQAMTELVTVSDTLAPDVKATLVAATKAVDCTVAATAARKLELFSDKRFIPKRPHTASIAAMMRGLCVLASYELLQNAADDSVLATYVPARGLERTEVSYDPLSEVDTDGDGDPHTERKTDLVPRAEVSLPDIEDMVRAMASCKDTTCTSDSREFRFTFKPAGGEQFLARIESVELPPCQDKPAP